MFFSYATFLKASLFREKGYTFFTISAHEHVFIQTFFFQISKHLCYVIQNCNSKNPYVSRRYILEVPCDGGGGSGGGGGGDRITLTSCPGVIFESIPHGGNYETFITWNEPPATTDCPGGILQSLIFLELNLVFYPFKLPCESEVLHNGRKLRIEI